MTLVFRSKFSTVAMPVTLFLQCKNNISRNSKKFLYLCGMVGQIGKRVEEGKEPSALTYKCVLHAVSFNTKHFRNR